jgi:hypothetical protein
VYSATCVMCHNDATSHIMTHDATLIVRTLLSHSTHFTFTLSTLSLSLSLYYIFLSLFFFFFKRRSDGRCGREEREERRRRRRGSEGTMRPHLGLNFLFIFSFYNLWGLVLSFVKIVADALFNFF